MFWKISLFRNKFSVKVQRLYSLTADDSSSYETLKEKLLEALKVKDIETMETILNKIEKTISPDEIPHEDTEKLAKIKDIITKQNAKKGKYKLLGFVLA